MPPLQPTKAWAVKLWLMSAFVLIAALGAGSGDWIVVALAALNVAALILHWDDVA